LKVIRSAAKDCANRAVFLSIGRNEAERFPAPAGGTGRVR